MVNGLARAVAHLRTPLFRNSYALMLGSATTSVLGVFYWIIAARQYSPDQVGSNSAAISAIMFLSGISLLSLDGALVRYIPIAGTQTTRIVGYTYLVCLGVAGLISLVFCLGLRVWSPQIGNVFNSSSRVAFFAISAIAWTAFTLEDSVLAGLRQAVWVPVANTSFALVKIGLLIVFAILIPGLGILASWMVPVLLILIPINFGIVAWLIPIHIRTTSERTRPRLPSSLARYFSSNYPGSLFFLTYTALLPVMITVRLGAQANAYFYLPWMMMNALQLIAMNMTTSFTVEATIERSQQSAYFRRSLIHTLRLVGALAIIIMIIAPFLLLNFGASYAEEGTRLLRLLALGSSPNVVIWLYIGIARVQNQTLGVNLVQGILCILVIGGSYWLLPLYGINSVGFVWLISQIVVAGGLLATKLRSVLKNAA